MRLLTLPILLTTATAFIIQTSESRHLPKEDLSVIPLRSMLTKPADKETHLHVHPLPKTPKGKSKRSLSRRSWSAYKSYNNPPPYLVFNRKSGAYYPYYSFPTAENSVRRSRVRKVGRQ